MKITVIYGTMKKGNTYGLTQKFLQELKVDKSNVIEFFLPRDMPNFCRGCLKCLKNKKNCLDHFAFQWMIHKPN